MKEPLSAAGGKLNDDSVKLILGLLEAVGEAVGERVSPLYFSIAAVI